MNAKRIAIVAVVVLVVAVAAGFGGYRYGFGVGQTQATAVRAAFLAERGGGGQQASGAAGAVPGAAGAPGGASGNFVTGQVKSVDGDTIELSTAEEVLKVTVTGQTQMQKMGQGTVDDIQEGERLTVVGERGADGAISAQSIQIGGGFGGGMPPAQGANASRQLKSHGRVCPAALSISPS